MLVGVVAAGALGLGAALLGGGPEPTAPAEAREGAVESSAAFEPPDPEPRPQEPVRPSSTAADAPPPRAPVVEIPRAPPPVSRAPTAARPSRPPSRSARAASHREADPEDGLATEVALLGQARQALGRGDAARALELLDQHRQRFLRGKLAQERELSRITALCELGRQDEARAVATAFLDRNPSEALRRQLARRCVGTPSPSP